MKKINKALSIIKYGSNTLVNNNVHDSLSIDFNNIHNHGLIIDKNDEPIIIVSSGAVAFGKTIDSFSYINDEIIRKRILASVGNPHLSINWDKAIPTKTILQGLITHRDLTMEDSKESLKDIIYSIYENNNSAVIQINDNDFISDEELRNIRGGHFGDNDKLASLLAELCSEIFSEVRVIINTSSNGVLFENSVINELDPRKLTDEYINELCGVNKSSLGTGGMSEKLRTFRDLVNKNSDISVFIINGKDPKQLQGILNGENKGTRIRRK